MSFPVCAPRSAQCRLRRRILPAPLPDEIDGEFHPENSPVSSIRKKAEVTTVCRPVQLFH